MTSNTWKLTTTSRATAVVDADTKIRVTVTVEGVTAGSTATLRISLLGHTLLMQPGPDALTRNIVEVPTDHPLAPAIRLIAAREQAQQLVKDEAREAVASPPHYAAIEQVRELDRDIDADPVACRLAKHHTRETDTMTKTTKTKRYTIRPLGKTSWSETDSLVEARRLQQECSDRMSGETIVIVDETTGETI